ncbi:helicase domino isoform X2 [Daktulosphaira vitifoliae]|uniref:helicase domino isoform X2 n=1 Tax=Daktulosphaira vitifoliae TaxID=58002 RepID=UPI0021AADBFC|nr:helicase domino isoform X2 [Daktulosphaira vitifoliae]
MATASQLGAGTIDCHKHNKYDGNGHQVTSGIKFIPNNCDNLIGVNGSSHDVENTTYTSDNDDSADSKNRLSRKRKYSAESAKEFEALEMCTAAKIKRTCEMVFEQLETVRSKLAQSQRELDEVQSLPKVLDFLPEKVEQVFNDQHPWSESNIKCSNDPLFTGDPFAELKLWLDKQSIESQETSLPISTNKPIKLITSNSSIDDLPNFLALRQSNENQPDQVIERVKWEAQVLQRINQLQRDGLWSDRRLPKIYEPPRLKAHHDYLLEEMQWLATDFAQERKWKKKAAKQCANMVKKYFHEKKTEAQKAAKASEMHQKRITGFIAKMVKTFWSNVEKLVEFKQSTKLEEKRKIALDEHLNFIVDQTEKMSTLVAESLMKSANNSMITTSHNSSLPDEYINPSHTSSDDEETIENDEKQNSNELERKNEVDMLKKESKLSIDDVLDQLPKGYLETRAKELENKKTSYDKSEDEDFEASNSSWSDDEETLLIAEKEEGGIDHSKEIAELEAENEMSIEQILAMYNVQLPNNKNDNNDDDEDDEEDSIDSSSTKEEITTEDVGLKYLLRKSPSKMPNGTNECNADKEINDVTALAESIQPKGNTLSSTSVVTKVPFLLRNTLREYQHIGLDWLVTMYEQNLNGILADEMGLGKTIQTIALLAHLACEKEDWGPHLIVVPTSVMLNWEMEIKKWCPSFKILTYYGSVKERKLKRIGWTKPNAFHICITSYKLVITDHQSFRRKKWKYLILDEAQNIKNFKSQRWQLLLNFQSERRLLLTGTPLQNNLMELWSLMHFLMPNIFASHREFKEWFSNPVTGMIEGNAEYNETIIKKLHKVLRPFILRRLKCEVEKQLPKKYEHVIMCRLSKRQRYLYDDFMSRAKTKETLATGNMLSVINVLMQLRKVCNHPNLFEPRPTISPFQMEAIAYSIPRSIFNILEYNPFNEIDLNSVNLLFTHLELIMSAWMAHRLKRYQLPNTVFDQVDSLPDSTAKLPKIKMNFNMKLPKNLNIISKINVSNPQNKLVNVRLKHTMPIIKLLVERGVKDLKLKSVGNNKFRTPGFTNIMSLAPKIQQIKENITLKKDNDSLFCISKNRTKVLNQTLNQNENSLSLNGKSNGNLILKESVIESKNIGTANSPTIKKVTNSSSSNLKYSLLNISDNTVFNIPSLKENRLLRRQSKMRTINFINNKRIDGATNVIYGCDLRDFIRLNPSSGHVGNSNSIDRNPWLWLGSNNVLSVGHQYSAHIQRMSYMTAVALSESVKTVNRRMKDLQDSFDQFIVYVPAVQGRTPKIQFSVMKDEPLLEYHLKPFLNSLHPIISAMSVLFPDQRLIQYDCGKLQSLDHLLRRLKAGHHRALIFTQMTKMLDVLEAFLNYHGYIYLRLDGTTKVETRQLLMERFNADKRYFCFILSTRSGGVGINLTGADTVIFYDSDWNPTMDAQAQDRCHRIGQTRDVHIYRLISEKTIEENILKKANQKRLLGDLAIEGGNFTASFFKSTTIQELFEVNTTDEKRSAHILESEFSQSQSNIEGDRHAINIFENALAAAEDETDVVAAKIAKEEAVADLAEFDEAIPIDDQNDTKLSKADLEVQALEKQLSPLEKWAMSFIESSEMDWASQQMAAAEAELEQQKQEWKVEQQQAAKRTEERINQKRKHPESDGEEEKDNEDLTFINKFQIIYPNHGSKKSDVPKQLIIGPWSFENEFYHDPLYFNQYCYSPMTEAQLPPLPSSRKRPRTDATFISNRSCLPASLSSNPKSIYGTRDNNAGEWLPNENTFPHLPRSMFDRASGALLKMRNDIRLQRYRGINRPMNMTLASLKPPLPARPVQEPAHVPDWLIHEDYALLQAVQRVQEMTLNLVILCPAHTPNWDLVSELVNMMSRVYRSPKQCKNRYESVIVAREEGRMLQEQLLKKQKKKINRGLRTSQIYTSDDNRTHTQLLISRFNGLLSVAAKRQPLCRTNNQSTSSQLANTPLIPNASHINILKENYDVDYNVPLGPMQVISRRTDRMIREKQQQQLADPSSSVRIQQQQAPTVKSIQLPNSLPTTQPAVVSPVSVRPSTSTQHRIIMSSPSIVQDSNIQNIPQSSPKVVPMSVHYSAAVQRALNFTQASIVTQASSTTGKIVTTMNKTITQSQIQMYRQQQQNIARQQQVKMVSARATNKTSSTNIPVQSSQTSTNMNVRPKSAINTRNITDTDVTNFIKRHQLLQQKQAQCGTTQSTISSASPSIVKTSVQNLMLSTGTKNALTVAATTKNINPQQQFRQLTLQQPMLAHRKIPAQKVTQLSQVVVAGKTGVPTQLIVQSKGVPSTMTMQQLQTMMKQQNIQNVSVSGANITAMQSNSNSSQVISHVIAKNQGQTSSLGLTRVLPVVTTQTSLKQTIQVVNPVQTLRTTSGVGIESTRTTLQPCSLSNVFKTTGSTGHSPNILSQVVFQQGQQMSVRQGQLRVQNSSGQGGSIVAVSMAPQQQQPTVLTIPSSPSPHTPRTT